MTWVKAASQPATLLHCIPSPEVPLCKHLPDSLPALTVGLAVTAEEEEGVRMMPKGSVCNLFLRKRK